MDSFIHVAGWSQHMSPRSSSTRPFGHIRSLSSVAVTSASSPPSPNSQRPRVPFKSPSTSQLPTFSLSSPAHGFNDEMSTLPDPRSRVADLANDNEASNPIPSRHPDLNDEVATLSTKLINAINHQTVLDDTLSATRHELKSAHEHIRELESRNASQRETLAGDVWIRRSVLETERKTLQTEKRNVLAKLAGESGKRIEVEREKRKIEQELENLTTALFEEANRMVIGAKEEAKAQHDALQRKNDQLKSQLADSESLLKSQQEQLSELKQVMETMVIERDDQTNGTAPSSPGIAKFESNDDGPLDTYAPPVTSPLPESFAPAPPTSFQHLIHPVLRTDLASYDDFMSLTRLSHRGAGSRISSGSMGGLNAWSLGLGGSTSSAHPSNASTTSLAAGSIPASNSAPQSPHTPVSTSSPGSANPAGIPIPNLKETRFFKRVLAEDVEPTLRLDAAPGLSWLARRAVLSSVTDGNLIVEPVSNNANSVTMAKPQFYPCALCGESRKDEAYQRLHRFRTSEAESAQRYPLCNYCLSRVRSTCDFLGFLRMVKDGHLRADDEDHEKAAWEESVRLRDQMFWSRIGGGVIPTSQTGLSAETAKSRRPSETRADASNPKAEYVKAPTDNDGGDPSTDDEAVQKAQREARFREPHTPPEQTERAAGLRRSIDSTESHSNSGSETAKESSVTEE